MPLDADARAVLDRVRAAGIAPWCQQTVLGGRRVYEQRIRLMEPRPIPVTSVRDIRVPGRAGEIDGSCLPHCSRAPAAHRPVSPWRRLGAGVIGFA